MAKVLLVDADGHNRIPLQEGLAAAGYEVVVAPTGSFALTMLERERPDLIVSQAHIQDMDGFELCAIVRSDPASTNTLFLILAQWGAGIPNAAARARADMVLLGSPAAASVVTWVGILLGHGGRTNGLPGRGVAAGAGEKAAFPEDAPSLQGSLLVFDLMELTQAIGGGRKTGRLTLTLRAGDGTILFNAGRVVHAEFGERKGEQAFTALVAASQEDSHGTFCFVPSDGDEAAVGLQAIQGGAQQLAIEFATPTDEAEVAEGNGQGRALQPASGKDD
jgi:CheY-like chemotaxis protein